MDVKNSIRFVISTLLCIAGLQLYGDEKALSDWQLARDRDGIQVYLKAIPGSAIKAFMGVVEIDSSLDSLSGLMNDIQACPQWVHRCRSPRILQTQGFSERYAYQVSDFPFPAHNRDVIHHVVIRQEPASGSIIIHLHAAPAFCQDNPLEGCQIVNRSNNIRIKRSQGIYRLEPIDINRTRVTWEQHVEPGGNLPNWMVNSMLVEMPYITLKNLSELVKLDKYQTAKLAYDGNGLATGFEIKNW